MTLRQQNCDLQPIHETFNNSIKLVLQNCLKQKWCIVIAKYESLLCIVMQMLSKGEFCAMFFFSYYWI